MINVRGTIFAKKLLGLVALQVAMLLGWRTYDVFQPQILRSLDLVSFASVLLLLQGAFTIFLEPLMGHLSDKTLLNRGSRTLSIALGVIVAGLIFVASAAVLQLNQSPVLYWLVPLLMILWLAAMSSFRSPATSLLYRYVSTQTLPIAVSVLVMVNGIIGAVGFYLNRALLSMGASTSFILAGLVLVLGVLILHFVSREDRAPIEAQPLPEVSVARLALIWSLALGTGFILSVLLYVAPVYLSVTGMPDADALKSIILLLSALFCIPAVFVSMYAGLGRTFISSVVALVLVLCLLLLEVPVPKWGVVFALGVLLGCALNTMFPLGFSALPERRAGLATGFVVSGLGASFVAFTVCNQIIKISAEVGMGILVAAAGLVVSCVRWLEEK